MRKALHVQDVGGYDEGRFLDTLWPRSPNGPVFPFGTPLLETLFGFSAFFLTLPEILFSVNPSAECGEKQSFQPYLDAM